jgi:hypothetical protein
MTWRRPGIGVALSPTCSDEPGVAMGRLLPPLPANFITSRQPREMEPKMGTLKITRKVMGSARRGQHGTALNLAGAEREVMQPLRKVWVLRMIL